MSQGNTTSNIDFSPSQLSTLKNITRDAYKPYDNALTSSGNRMQVQTRHSHSKQRPKTGHPNMSKRPNLLREIRQVATDTQNNNKSASRMSFGISFGNVTGNTDDRAKKS